MATRQEQIDTLERSWAEDPRWTDVTRPYSAADVVRLRGSMQPEASFARNGAEKLWDLIHGGARKGYVNCMGAITGGQALQQAKAGVEAIYLSGWQVACLRSGIAALTLLLLAPAWRRCSASSTNTENSTLPLAPPGIVANVQLTTPPTSPQALPPLHVW